MRGFYLYICHCIVALVLPEAIERVVLLNTVDCRAS